MSNGTTYTAPPVLVSVRGLVVFSGKFLLVQRSLQDRMHAGLWEFPGGKIDASETLINSLIREVGEETGLVVESTSPLVLAENKILTDSPYKDLLHITLCCTMRTKSDLVRLSNEHEKAQWIRTTEIVASSRVTPVTRTITAVLHHYMH